MRKISFIAALALLMAVYGLTVAQSQQDDLTLQEQLNAFMAANPRVKVTYNPAPDYVNTMQIAFDSGSYANIFFVDSSNLSDWAAAGVIAPAEGHLDDVEDIYPTLREAFSVNGSLQCAP